MKATCKNSANLEQETKTTEVVTYPLLSLASSVGDKQEKKERERERNNNGGLRRGREGREPVRTSLMTHFCPPLV